MSLGVQTGISTEFQLTPSYWIRRTTQLGRCQAAKRRSTEPRNTVTMSVTATQGSASE